MAYNGIVQCNIARTGEPMNSRKLSTNALPKSDAPETGPEQSSDQFSVRVNELSERERRRLLMHFLALDKDDRLLRFGSTLPDELITQYVQKLNFSRDKVFGVYDSSFRLVGVGHLAFAPREALPILSRATL